MVPDGDEREDSSPNDSKPAVKINTKRAPFLASSQEMHRRQSVSSSTDSGHHQRSTTFDQDTVSRALKKTRIIVNGKLQNLS